MSFKFINKIGLELEGGWIERRPDLVGDESLKEADFSDCGCYGELVGKPMSSEAEVLAFIKENWPDATSPRCGYHIHFSLKTVDLYSLCMEQKFYDNFLAAMEKWGKDTNCKNEEFWSRLRGENKYCQRIFQPHKQAACRTKDEARQNHIRRTHWNFCYRLYGTLECRLLPTFKDVKMALSATSMLIKFIEDYLTECQPNESKYNIKKRFDVREVPEVSKVEVFDVNSLTPKKRKLKKRSNNGGIIKNRNPLISYRTVPVATVAVDDGVLVNHEKLYNTQQIHQYGVSGSSKLSYPIFYHSDGILKKTDI